MTDRILRGAELTLRGLGAARAPFNCDERILRLGGTSVANGSRQGASVVSNSYDQYGGTMPDTPGGRQHDGNYNSSVFYRGTSPARPRPRARSRGYDITGNTTTVQSGTGAVQLSTTSTTNYYAPSTVTPNNNSNLGSSFQFNGAMEL
jgi:hypothetical protein